MRENTNLNNLPEIQKVFKDIRIVHIVENITINTQKIYKGIEILRTLKVCMRILSKI